MTQKLTDIAVLKLALPHMTNTELRKECEESHIKSEDNTQDTKYWNERFVVHYMELLRRQYGKEEVTQKV